MEFLFLRHVADLGFWIYPLIFIGVIAEGEAVLLAVSFMASLGLLSVWWVVVMALTGTYIGDWLWYVVGRFPVKFTAPLRFITDKISKPFLSRFSLSPFGMIFISKFTYGIHHSLLVQAGVSRMSPLLYNRIIIISIIVWVAAITSAGYFFGASFEALKHYIKYGEIGLLLGLIILVLSERFIRRVANEKI